jgi:hypothetical protein
LKPVFTDAELEAYLDEGLDPNRAAELERCISKDKKLLARLSRINGRRDAGIHTLGEIWRRNQIGVPSVEKISNHLLGVLSKEESDYIMFRIDVLRCPYTIAMYRDLSAKKDGDLDRSEKRRTKFFNSSAGLLRRKGKTRD